MRLDKVCAYMAVAVLAVSVLEPATFENSTTTPESPWQPPTDDPAFSIVYAGRLFGYFRATDIQQQSSSGCPAEDDLVEQSPTLKTFSHLLLNTTLSDPSRSRTLTVALGDNFAPDIYARIMMLAHPGSSQRMAERDNFTPKFSSGEQRRIAFDYDLRPDPALDAYKEFTSLEGQVPTDNVSCFLRANHFDAVVPGKHDFYFGPERLSQIARFLNTKAQGNYRPVAMLAANLVVSATVRNASPPLPVELKNSAVGDELTAPPRRNIKINIPAFVLPWLHQIPIDGLHDGERVCLFNGQPGDPDSALPREDAACTNPLRKAGDESSKNYELSPDGPDPRFVLNPDVENRAVCIAVTGGSRKWFCKEFAVRRPFLQPRNRKNDSLQPPPYLTRDFPLRSPLQNGVPEHGHDVVIFGVVDPALAQYIGLLNYSWWPNENKRWDIKLEVLDPVQSLKQMLETCKADTETNCWSRRKILLAQMPIDEARQVALRLKQTAQFDVVIAQSDEDLASGDEYMSRADESASGHIPQRWQPFLLSPATQWSVQDQPAEPAKAENPVPLSVRLQRADLFLTPNRQFLSNHPSSEFVPPASRAIPAKVTTLEQRFLRSKSQAVHSSVSKELLTDSALEAMRNHCRADVALLQERDVFGEIAQSSALWPTIPDPTLPQVIDAIFWKGDFVVCKPVTGASLVKALKTSDAFDKQKASGLQLSIEAGQNLKLLGIVPNERHDGYSIHGQPVDEKKLYAVAMTDYLAFGDTGYPDLAATDVPPAENIRTVELYPLSLAVCKSLGCSPDPDLKAPAMKAFKNKDYFDGSDLQPADQRRGFDSWQKVRDWFAHWQRPITPTATLFPQRTPSSSDQSESGQKNVDDRQKKEDAALTRDLEQKFDTRGLWYVSLEKLDFQYALTFISGSQETVAKNFAGISSVAQLSTVESSKVSSWARLRFGYSFPKWVDFYGVEEARYTRNNQRTAVPDASGNTPYQVSLKENTLQTEYGLLAKRLSVNLPFRFLVAERMATEIFEPFSLYQLPTSQPAGCVTPSTSTSGGPAPCVQVSELIHSPRNYLLTTKLGTRLENGHSWLELGWEVGRNIDNPLVYSFNHGSALEVDCAVTSTVALSACIQQNNARHGTPLVTASSPLSVETGNLHVSGGFLNWHFEVPAFGKIQLTSDNYSEAFIRRPDDTSINTRFYDDMIVSLPIPIWQNLSLTPQMEVFYYQNKILPHHFVSVTTSVGLDWGFDWHRGVGWKAFRFPNPSPAAKGQGLPAP